jgi:hypothetical protein
MIRSMQEFTSAFQAARCVSTPLVVIRTADPASATHIITETPRQGRQLQPVLGWDIVRGHPPFPGGMRIAPVFSTIVSKMCLPSR